MKNMYQKANKVFLAMFLMFCLMSYGNVETCAANSKVETAINWAIGIANDNSHGYSQSVRWGPHYDCSSFVYAAFRQAGFSLPGSGTRYTQTMVDHFTKAGFTWIPWNQIGSMNHLQRGDILLNNSSNSAKQHTEIYLGNGQNVGAHSPSKGISVSGYYNHPWLGVLRYSAVSAPTNPRISKNQYWYDLQDRIEITAHADGATDYYMSMFKDDNRIFAQRVEGGKFTLAASAYGIGHYTVCFSCSNSAGNADTGWIDFSVVGPAGYTDIRTSNWWYDLTDTVSISVDTLCAKYQFIGIDKEGVGRVVTESSDSTYKIAASRLGVGKYSAYFSVGNGSGSVDTRRVNFEIVEKPKSGATVSCSKKSYALNDEVEVSVQVYCSKYQFIGIDRNGVERAISAQTFDGKYRIPASRLGRGNYSAYFSVANSSGSYDTSRVNFSIDNPLTNPAISMDKTLYGKNENIKILASANGGVNYYTAQIYDSTGKEVVHKNFTGRSFLLNASSLGEGGYTARVLCNNYAFQAVTKRISFTVNYGDDESSKTSVSPGKPQQPSENSDSKEPEKDNEEYSGDAFDENGEEDSYTLDVGDVVEDIRNGDEYEILSVSGDVICVEYVESANPKAAIIKIPATIKTETGATCRVTAISKCAFKNNRRVKKVLIGSNITAIGTKAFSGCKNLITVIMGKNIVTIGSNAFSNCARLTSLTIPAKTAKIGANAFSGCNKLKKLEIKSTKLNAKGLNKRAFKGISIKTVIRVPKDKRGVYKRLLCQRGMSKKNKIE